MISIVSFHRFVKRASLLSVALSMFFASNIATALDIKSVIEQSGVSGGLFAHLGAKSGADTVALQKNEAVYV